MIVTFAFAAGEVKRSSGWGRMRSTSKTAVRVRSVTSIGLVRILSWALNLLSGPRTKTLEGMTSTVQPFLSFPMNAGWTSIMSSLLFSILSRTLLGKTRTALAPAGTAIMSGLRG